MCDRKKDLGMGWGGEVLLFWLTSALTTWSETKNKQTNQTPKTPTPPPTPETKTPEFSQCYNFMLIYEYNNLTAR